MATVLSYKKTDRLQNIRLRDNLIRLMRENNTNMTHIFKQTGVPITTIQRICKDPSANPTLASLIPIADFFSLTLAQLIGEDPLPNQASNQSAAQHWANVPVINWQEAIRWPKVSLDLRQPKVITTELSLNDKAFALEILDEHHDNFHRGSILIIDPTTKHNHRDYVVTHKIGALQASLKQILTHEGDIYLKPTNPEFKTTQMDSSYQILGVVVQVRMNLK